VAQVDRVAAFTSHGRGTQPQHLLPLARLVATQGLTVRLQLVDLEGGGGRSALNDLPSLRPLRAVGQSSDASVNGNGSAGALPHAPTTLEPSDHATPQARRRGNRRPVRGNRRCGVGLSAPARCVHPPRGPQSGAMMAVTSHPSTVWPLHLTSTLNPVAGSGSASDPYAAKPVA